jgi:hypothetical protein
VDAVVVTLPLPISKASKGSGGFADALLVDEMGAAATPLPGVAAKRLDAAAVPGTGGTLGGVTWGPCDRTSTTFSR